jgi:hypothetical protein
MAAAYLNFLNANQTLAGTGSVTFGDGDNLCWAARHD